MNSEEKKQLKEEIKKELLQEQRDADTARRKAQREQDEADERAYRNCEDTLSGD